MIGEAAGSLLGNRLTKRPCDTGLLILKKMPSEINEKYARMTINSLLLLSATARYGMI